MFKFKTLHLLLLLSNFVMAASFAAKIDGYKFNDLNGNGIDDNEPRLAGVRILVQSQTNPELLRQAFTDANGKYSFSQLPPGSYQICEIPPAGPPVWVPTTPECVKVNLRGKNSYIRVVFGNREQNGGGTTGGGTTGGGTTGGGTTGGGTTGGGTTGGGTTGGGTTGGGTAGGGTTGGGTTGGGEIGCTRTQGYWGNSPAGEARLNQLVGSGITLGNRNYTAAELDAILDTPTGGNALISLAHQLIAAKLNDLAGADSSQVDDDIAAAEGLIGNLVIPPVGSDNVEPSSPLGQQMNTVKDTLDDYNNGELNVPHCP